MFNKTTYSRVFIIRTYKLLNFQKQKFTLTLIPRIHLAYLFSCKIPKKKIQLLENDRLELRNRFDTDSKTSLKL